MALASDGMRPDNILATLLLLSGLSIAAFTLVVLEVVESISTVTQSVSPASPQYYGTPVTFQCSYRNSTGPIDQSVIGNNCSIIFDSENYSMTYNAATENYTLTNDSLSVGTHTWYCGCVSFFYFDRNGTPETYVIESGEGAVQPAPEKRIPPERRLTLPEVGGGNCIAQQLSAEVLTVAGTRETSANIDILYNDGTSWKKYGSTISGPDGAVNFIPLYAGTYELETNKLGFTPASTTFTVSDCKGRNEFEAKKDLYLPCASDAECKSNACSEGICKPIKCECGRIAANSVCVNYECCADSQCPPNSLCQRNRCEPKASCSDSSTCSATKYCSNGFCEEIRCPSPDYIENHACVVECLSNSDCRNGQECFETKCLSALSDAEKQLRVNYKEAAGLLCVTDGLDKPVGADLQVTLPDNTSLIIPAPAPGGCISTTAFPLGKLQAKVSKSRYKDTSITVSIVKPQGAFGGIDLTQAGSLLLVLIPVAAVGALMLLRNRGH